MFFAQEISYIDYLHVYFVHYGVKQIYASCHANCQRYYIVTDELTQSCLFVSLKVFISFVLNEIC